MPETLKAQEQPSHQYRGLAAVNRAIVTAGNNQVLLNHCSALEVSWITGQQWDSFWLSKYPPAPADDHEQKLNYQLVMSCIEIKANLCKADWAGQAFLNSLRIKRSR
ncbi:hypothetical protein [Vibrio fortis]|uniref:hypothetical protein n=1 Tax=Vibrio fortis TaxID=212667 RepID=UPI001CDA20BB|nr:hypothetical protein [Vibrio fortis]